MNGGQYCYPDNDVLINKYNIHNKELLQKLEIKDAEITAVTIAKSKLLGHYHMMMGQNPVYVIAFGGKNI